MECSLVIWFFAYMCVGFFPFGASDFLQVEFMAIVCHCTGHRDFWLFKSQVNFHLNLLKDNIVSFFSYSFNHIY